MLAALPGLSRQAADTIDKMMGALWITSSFRDEVSLPVAVPMQDRSNQDFTSGAFVFMTAAHEVHV